MLATTVGSVHAADRVNGDLKQFNDNGAWCWYQDERVVVDHANQTMLIASIADSDGVGGQQRGGDVDVTCYHLATGQISQFVLHHDLQREDDHNTPAILIRPDGRYLAVYTKHNQDNLTRWRISTRPHDATQWEPEQTFDWTKKLEELSPKCHVTYSNLFYLSAENRTYDFVRGINDDPSILISDNQGSSWSFGGKLLTIPKLGYVNGYTKYASNNVNRIDFITTEHHPRDYNNSIYHGYVQGGKLYDSFGKIIDDSVLDDHGQPQTKLTKIFAANSVWNGETMSHAWTVDLHVDKQDRPFGIISCRANDVPDNTNFNDHRFFYIRFDGKQWKVVPLAKAGARLWDSEQDYTGLGAVDPNNPNVVYVSTTIDPRDGHSLKHHEIFKGVSKDDGSTWNWSAITWDSTVDNLRPTVPIWSTNDSTVLWFRGTMSRSQKFDCAIVGIINQSNQSLGKVHYTAGTRANDITPGRYEIFAFFWADPNGEAQIQAGIKPGNLRKFRRRACEQARAEQFAEPVVLVQGERALYRASLGTVTVTNLSPIEITTQDSGAFAGIGYAPIISETSAAPK